MTIPPPLARKVLSRLRKKQHPDAHMAAIGLAVICNPVQLIARLDRIEFEPKKAWEDIDTSSWRDVHGYVTPTGRRRRGIAQDLVTRAEYGGRAAADIYDYIGRRNARNESARVGQFKITGNSPNTARITVGPDQRERRKKYIWERVGVQRWIAGVGAAALITGSSIAGKKLRTAGGGDAWVGLKNIAGRAANKTRNVISKAVGGSGVKPFEPHVSDNQRVAENYAKVQADQAVQAEKKAQTKAKYKKTMESKFGPNYMRTKDKPVLHPEGHPEAGKPTGEFTWQIKRRPAPGTGGPTGVVKKKRDAA